jgi:hypothetical protein
LPQRLDQKEHVERYPLATDEIVVSQGQVDEATGGEGVSRPPQESGNHFDQLRVLGCILFSAEEVPEEQKGPVATQGEGEHQEDIVDGGQREKRLPRHGQQGILQLVAVEDEADAQRVEKKRRV